MLTLDQWTATYVLDAFKKSAKTARKELNKKVHVMEITNAILNRNAPGSGIKISDIKKVLFEAAPNITYYEGEDEITKMYYLESRGKLLLIGPSFSSVQRVIRNISSLLQIDTLDVGHTAGFGREERNTVVGFRIKQALLAPGTISRADVNTLFSKYDRELNRIHMDYKVNLSKSSSLASTLVGKFDFIYTVPQDSNLNRNILGPKEAKVARLFTKGIVDLTDVKTSPSIMEMMYNQLVNAFLGIKIKQEKFTKRMKGGVDFDKDKASVRNVTVAPNKDNNADLNTVRLQTLINLKLHDQIRQNMGKGRSKNVLNYRTGRFARSAEAQAVIQSRQDRLDIYYTYQRDPYDVFLPGGRLYKPGRDPRSIIGRSIRQLAREYISNNFKVNPVLRDKV